MPTPQYRDLGPTQLLKAAVDSTGRNQGNNGKVDQAQSNWTITADPQDLNCHVAQAEVYQISIDGPVGSRCSLYRNSRLYNKMIQGWANNYDPVNPLYIRPGDTLFMFWNAQASLWLPQP